MKAINITNGAEIQKLVTKFFYKDNHLHYQIMIDSINQERYLYKEFSNYKAYKETLQKLKKCQRERLAITFLENELKKIKSKANMA